MDLGLGNLDTVRKYVLPAPMWNDTQWDTALASIALGAARRFENYCDRKFARLVNAVVTFNANRSMYVLPRYPLETVASLQLRATSQDDWEDVTQLVIQQDETAGILYFGTSIAESIVMLRITFTGGFWYETLEPTQADGTPTPGYPSVQPGAQYDPNENEDGSFALLDPTYGAADLQQAWLMQILHEFKLKDDLLPEGLADKNKKSRTNWRLDETQLLPEVQNVVNQYRRMAIV